MNLILLSASDFIEDGKRGRVRLTGRRLEHVVSVHRARKGDTLRVGLVGGNVGTGTVTLMRPGRLEMEVKLTEPPPPPLPLTLLLALPRPKTLKKVLIGATAMGVKHFVLMRTWRVDKSYFQSPSLRENAVKEQFVLGLEQGRDTIMPKLEIRNLFKPFVEDEVPSLVRKTRAFVAHPGAEADCPRGVKRPVTLAIGPEGGFVGYELELLAKQGFAPISLGPRPLRVEDAVPALIGRIL